MKQIVKTIATEAVLTLSVCLVASAVIIFSGVSTSVFERSDASHRFWLDKVLFAAFSLTFGAALVSVWNCRRLFREVKLRKEAEQEVRVLRHANRARAAEIMLALDENEFQVYYQPIVELKTDRITSFEALVRWQHSTHGVLSPASFMPFVEERELIVSLSKYMLRSVARQITEWRAAFPEASLPTISVNLSWQHSVHSDIVEDVKEILAEFDDFVPRYLCFELTETTAAQNIEMAVELTRQFRALGIAVSIDDFGTGYSSLSYLGDIPATSVKIDRSFIKRMLEQTRSDIVVRSVIKMAKELNLQVIAEGVETDEQMRHLLALGCEFGQGYLFARPLCASEAQRMILFQTNKRTARHPETPLDYLIETA